MNNKSKKLKGFTLVELIVVVAIFGIIMAAALTIIQPVGNLYTSTVKYENARSASANVRQYVEEMVKYSDKFQAVTGTDSYPSDQVDSFINYFGKTVGPGTDIPIYVMEIKNDAVCSANDNGSILNFNSARGQVSLYKDGVLISDFAVNQRVYDEYGFKIKLDPTFSENHMSATLEIFNLDKKNADVVDTNRTIPYDEESGYSTALTFSMMNIHQMDTIVYYHSLHSSPAKLITKDEILDTWVKDVDYNVNEEDKPRYIDVVDLGGDSENVYFIYTTPKHVNEYDIN